MPRKTLPPKPEKPYPGFPLFPHATGRWAKKIRQKLHYFGPWDDPDAALNKYLEQRDDLHAGRTPRSSNREAVSVADLCNAFLDAKELLLKADELSPRTFNGYHATSGEIVSHFGKRRLVTDLRPADFDRLRASFARRWGPTQLGVMIRRVRMVFKYGYDAEILKTPIRFGPHFKPPSGRVVRENRNGRGLRMYEPEELRTLLNAAGEQLRAMILLGINAGFGQTDCSTLPIEAVDLESGWLDHPRPKTGVPRRIPLWPETIEALRIVLAGRSAGMGASPEHDSLLFLTRRGNPWVRMQVVPNPKPGTSGFTAVDAVGVQFRILLKEVGIESAGRGFYGLRHTFATVAGDTRDQVAVDAIMGHVDGTMAGTYREKIEDDRLRVVVGHVREWIGFRDIQSDDLESELTSPGQDPTSGG